jgi:hypothetical protein
MGPRNASEPAQENAARLDVESMATIRSLMHAEPPTRAMSQNVPKRDRRAALISGDPTTDDLDVGAARAERVPRAKDTHPNDASKPSQQNGLLLTVLGHAHTQKIVLAVGVLLLVYFRPWLVVSILLLWVFLVAGIFLMLGYDGFWRRSMKAARWYAKRRPARAVELHRKLDAFAMKWDAVLDRFPEGTVDGLYLPDFRAAEHAQVQQDAAIDRRLSQIREG